MEFGEHLLRDGRLGVDLAERLPSEPDFHVGEILQRTELDERGTLARTLEIEHVADDAERTLGRILGVGAGGLLPILAIDHDGRVERLADLDDGGVGQLAPGTQRGASVSFQTVFAIEDKQTLRGEGVANGFGNALADPVEVGRRGVVGEGQNQNGLGTERAGKKHRQCERPYHVHYSVTMAAYPAGGASQEEGTCGRSNLCGAGCQPAADCQSACRAVCRSRPGGLTTRRRLTTCPT